MKAVRRRHTLAASKMAAQTTFTVPEGIADGQELLNALVRAVLTQNASTVTAATRPQLLTIAVDGDIFFAFRNASAGGVPVWDSAREIPVVISAGEGARCQVHRLPWVADAPTSPEK